MKKLLLGLLVCFSVNAFGEREEDNLLDAKSNIVKKYKIFLEEMDIIGQLKYLPQFKSISLSNSSYEPLNINFNNLNRILANIVPSSDRYIKSVYQVQVNIRNNPATPTEINFIRHSDQPAVGAPIQEQDIINNKIVEGRDLIKSSTSNAMYLTQVIVEKDVQYGKIDYVYMFSKTSNLKKDNMCDGYIYDPQKNIFEKIEMILPCF